MHLPYHPTHCYWLEGTVGEFYVSCLPFRKAKWFDLCGRQIGTGMADFTQGLSNKADSCAMLRVKGCQSFSNKNKHTHVSRLKYIKDCN